MTLSQIECFLLVAEKMSFTKAGEILYVSQPAISRRISLLEEEMGVTLFYRNNSKLELTESGKQFHTLFKKFIGDYKQTLKEAKNENVQIQGKVRMGCIDGWDISAFFNKAHKLITAEYPNITVSLEYLDHEDLAKKLGRNELDLVIEQQELFTNIRGVRLTPLCKTGCILMYSKNHSLAENDSRDLNLSSFRDSIFYLRSSDKLETLGTPVIQACLSAGFQPKLEYVSSQSAAYAKMLTGDGVFFADEYIIERSNPLFKYISLPTKRTIALANNNVENKAVCLMEKAIIDCSKEIYAK